jgi:hypothetical protein
MADLVEQNYCFSCAFWTANSENPRWRKHVAIIRGEAYFPLERTDRWDAQGKMVKIRYFDGRIVETDNLTYQGPIPDHMRKRPIFQDNAEFMHA